MSDAWAAWQEHTGEARQAPPAAEPVLPVQPHDEAVKRRPAKLMQWLENTRKLSPETVDAFGLYVHPHRFQARPEEDAQPALVFSYLHQGQLVNRAYRLLSADVVETEPAALPSLFNADAIDAEDPQEIIVAQRELDVMALHEAGYPQAVCLPQIAGGDEARFRALATHEGMLAKATRITLALDSTDVGLALREELARRLGRHRCRLAHWSPAAPTVGTLLMHWGKEAVAEAIAQAEPYPLEGIHRVTARGLLELYDAPPPPTMGSGIGVLDKHVAFPTDGRFIVTLGIPNHGKALALDTLVPTPDGWTTMGAIQTGDRVYAPDGSITTVAKAWPVLLGRTCYRVSFSDGSSVIADEDHLWVTRCEKARRSMRNAEKIAANRIPAGSDGRDQSHKRTYPSAKSTAEIRATLWDTSARQPVPRLNHSVAVAAAIDGCRPWPLQIPPYTLGVWLGDGDSTGGRITCAEVELIDHLRADGNQVDANRKPLAWRVRGLTTKLRMAGLVQNKHIPAACLRSLVDDRRALLQGLMDTDGYAAADGTAEFCTIRSDLAEQVFELVASLGYKPRMYEGRATIEGRDCGAKYRVSFVPDQNAFRLPRKRNAVQQSKQSRMRAQWRKIVAVEPVSSRAVRCITVEHSSQQYLVGKAMIPTHNTPFIRHIMVYQMEHHDRRWAVFSPEMRPWTRFVASCAQVFLGKPFQPSKRDGGLLTMTRDEVAFAADWLRKRLVMIVPDAESTSPTLAWLFERAKEAVLAEGITDVWIDPWNEIAHDRGQQREDEYLRDNLMRLLAFSARYGVNFWVNVHPPTLRPTKPGEKIQAPGAYDIAGGAMFFNKADLMLTVHRPADQAITEIYVRKAKADEYGRRGDKIEIQYNPTTGRYGTPAV